MAPWLTSVEDRQRCSNKSLQANTEFILKHYMHEKKSNNTSHSAAHSPPGKRKGKNNNVHRTEGKILQVNHTACLSLRGHIDDNVTLHQSGEKKSEKKMAKVPQ